MASKIFDIVLLSSVLISGIFGIYYAIKLRIKSNATAMKENEDDDQNILRIFEDLQKKAIEINPDLAQVTEAYLENQTTLRDYQEYIITNADYTTVSTSNHVAV